MEVSRGQIVRGLRVLYANEEAVLHFGGGVLHLLTVLSFLHSTTSIASLLLLCWQNIFESLNYKIKSSVFKCSYIPLSSSKRFTYLGRMWLLRKKCSCCRNNFFTSCFWSVPIWWKNDNLFYRLYREGIIWNIMRLDSPPPPILYRLGNKHLLVFKA